MIEQARHLGLDLGDDVAERLVAFETLLLDHAVRLGFVSATDAARIRARHTLDCLRAVLVVRSDDRTAFDVGSGAGLPGVVVACAVPSLSVTLVEPRRRRAAFLELVVERLELDNACVLLGRAESLEGSPADLCFARAFASLPDAWKACRRLLRSGGRFVYFAGAGFSGRVEVPDAGSWELLATPFLESFGPLVIMTRQ